MYYFIVIKYDFIRLLNKAYNLKHIEQFITALILITIATNIQIGFRITLFD